MHGEILYKNIYNREIYLFHKNGIAILVLNLHNHNLQYLQKVIVLLRKYNKL